MIRLTLICLLFAALLGGTVYESLGTSQAPADFTFINRGDHKSLDPGIMSWLQDIRVAYALWEGLYTPDPVTLRPVPGVADGVQIDPTRKIYTFHLRPSARWSNGDAVTSRDFLFSWRRMLEQPAEYTGLYFYIQGAENYCHDYAAWVQQADQGTGLPSAAAAPPDFSRVGIKTPDDATVVVTLRNPTPFFLSLCAFPPFFPLHEPSMRPYAEIDKTTGRVFGYDETFTRPPHLVSNGPYRMAEWVFKRNLRMVANDYYWNKAAVHCRIIDEPVIEDSLAALRAYLSGRVDWLSWVEEDLIGQMRHAGGYPDLHTFQSFGTEYYILNCLPRLPDGQPNPMADVRVRRALAMSIDKRIIVENVTKAGQQAADTYIPPTAFAGYPSPKGLHFDPEQARKLLADAGYPGGRGFPALNISFNPEMPNRQDTALILRSQWEQNLGIHLSLDPIEVKVFGVRLHTHDLEIARSSWFGDYPDPTTFADIFRSDSDDNNPAWYNKDYDALCAKAETQTDPAERLRTFSEAENLLLEQAPIIPLYYYIDAYMFRPNIKGIQLDSRDMVMFQGIEVLGRETKR
jgi:oligopeptide transport system substrate-binding protein